MPPAAVSGSLCRAAGVKVFAETPDTVDLRAFIPVFHRIVQGGKLDGILVDVAEYTHVPDGPAVILVAHEGQWILDGTGGRLGLLYSQRRPPAGSPETHLARALGECLKGCLAVSADEKSGQRIDFPLGAVEITLNDRLAAPNVPGTYDRFEPLVTRVLGTAFGGAQVSLKRETDPRRRCAVVASCDRAPGIPAALDNLA